MKLNHDSLACTWTLIALGTPLVCSAPLFAQSAPVAPPATPASWTDAIKEGRFWLDTRLRYEDVDQDGISKSAHALTLRTALGIETKSWNGFTGTLEFEDVAPLGDERFDSTTNGKTDYPTVADPEGAEINQAFIRYSSDAKWSTSVGRQRIVLDNQRFVGNVGWRQNEQTFDAASAKVDMPGDIALFAAYVDNVDRIYGDNSPNGDHRMHSWLVNASREFGVAGRLALYAYLLDNLSAPTSSTNTFGGRWTGKHRPEDALGFQWALEYATQSDAADNTLDIDQDYTLLEVGALFSDFSLLVGHETLGGSGDPGDAFQTPLATGHAFNGWADKFLTTPDDGLKDLYVALGAKVDAYDAKLVWHDFQSDSGGDDYGTEWDAQVQYGFSKSCSVGVKLASYQADEFATDTTKWWLWVGGSL